ncbi:MAG: exo-alpha-sialidase, partial [Anaerohalosphaera sp.]|nr:exo-alpha-sialidase [Anaerohalosphaera sp.]
MRNLTIITTLMLSITCLLEADTAHPPASVIVFKPGLAGVKQYRIPSLLCTAEGTLIALADARVDRPGDIPNNVDLAIRRSFDGGQTWGPVQIIANYGKPAGYKVPWGAADAAMVYDKNTKTIICLYTLGQGVGIAQSKPGLDGHTCQIHLIKSTDEGKTWSRPFDITPQCKPPAMRFFGTAPGVGIQTSTGKLVFCIYTTEDSRKLMTPYLITSDDHGKTWKLSETWSEKKTSVTETQIVELPDKSWLINSRNHYGKGKRLTSLSRDEGKTWSTHKFDPALNCPTCMASLIATNDPRDRQKQILVFANPDSTKGRKNGTVRLSEDNGKTWRWSKLVKPGAYAYSCLTALPDDSIGLFYEMEAGQLRFMRITLDWLTDGTIKTEGKMLKASDPEPQAKKTAKPTPPKVVSPLPDNEATIMRLPDDSLKIFWASKGDKTIKSIASNDNGQTWSDPSTEFAVPGVTYHPSQALLDSNGQIHQFFIIFRDGTKRNIDVWMNSTDPQRKKWGTPKCIHKGRVGALRTVNQLSDGRIILGIHEYPKLPKPEVTGPMVASVLISDDHAKTWKRNETELFAPIFNTYNGNSYGAVEPCILDRKDNSLWMLIRTQTGWLYESSSNDRGQTWSLAKPSGFYCTNSPCSFVRLKDGRVVLMWHNCENPMRFDGKRIYTNRDVLHAAIAWSRAV